MPVDRATFDSDQAAELQATTDYIAAVDAFLALPPVIDLQAEDDAVKAAGDAVAAARGRIPGSPPPP